MRRRYPPLAKPWALMRWAERVRVPERFVYPTDMDILWLAPMKNPAKGNRRVGHRLRLLLPKLLPSEAGLLTG